MVEFRELAARSIPGKYADYHMATNYPEAVVGMNEISVYKKGREFCVRSKGSIMIHKGINRVWRSVLLFVLASFLPSTGCVTAHQGVNRNTLVIIPANTEVPSGGHVIEIDSYELVDELSEKDIKETTQKLGLAPLSKTAIYEEFEFRIWINLGGDANLLAIRSNGSENSASFFEINNSSDPIGFRKENLADPKSSWNKMIFELKSRLTTPKGLVRDPYFKLNRDEPLIVLEVLDKGEYRRVFYGKNTSFPDGKRLIAVCDYLAGEFNIEMDCN